MCRIAQEAQNGRTLLAGLLPCRSRSARMHDKKATILRGQDSIGPTGKTPPQRPGASLIPPSRPSPDLLVAVEDHDWNLESGQLGVPSKATLPPFVQTSIHTPHHTTLHCTARSTYVRIHTYIGLTVIRRSTK